jgi:hypothetical protein
MRLYLIVVAAATALAAGAPPNQPEKIVFSRVFPNVGQIGLTDDQWEQGTPAWPGRAPR